MTKLDVTKSFEDNLLNKDSVSQSDKDERKRERGSTLKVRPFHYHYRNGDKATSSPTLLKGQVNRDEQASKDLAFTNECYWPNPEDSDAVQSSNEELSQQETVLSSKSVNSLSFLDSGPVEVTRNFRARQAPQSNSGQDRTSRSRYMVAKLPPADETQTKDGKGLHPLPLSSIQDAS